MSNWRKCRSCRQVLATSEFGTEAPQTCNACIGDPGRRLRERAPGSSSESVRRHREKTGNAYGKAYAKARAAAVRRLTDKYFEEFQAILAEERKSAGLTPGQGA